MATSHSHNNCGHHHHQSADEGRLLIALVIIFVFMIVEIIGGIFSGSLALLADAGHMAADSAALVLALAAKWISRQEADKNRFTFGYERVQVLAGFVNGLGLLLLTAWLAWEAIQRILEPQPIMSGYMMVVAILGLIANLVAFKILHGGDQEDLNMRGAMLHVLGDIFGSVAAILSAIIIGLWSFYVVDALLTLCVSVLIARAAWPLLDEAGRILLQSAPQNISVEEVQQSLKAKIPEIVDIHAVHMWMLTARDTRIEMHIQVKSPENGQNVLQEAKRILADDFGIVTSTIQIDHNECADITKQNANGRKQQEQPDDGGHSSHIAHA